MSDEISALRKENERLRAELAAVRLCLAQASHDAGPAFVAHEALTDAQAEVARLKAGKFTEEEFQGLCHGFGEQDRARFCDGCSLYQRKLFGVSREEELRAALAEQREGVRGAVARMDGLLAESRRWREQGEADRKFQRRLPEMEGKGENTKH